MKDIVAAESENEIANYETTSLVGTTRRPISRDFYLSYGKRAFDIFIVVSTIWLTLPIILVSAAVVARDGGRPFFAHTRVGRKGREFKCLKVRSMVSDSDARLKAHLESDPEARAEWVRTRKLKNDPRITRFGRFLRKSSLDELPQIFNVLMGEMSIVGPRPVVRDELVLYGRNGRSYLEMRPGITGLWQVSGRNGVSYDERVSYDVKYSEACSLKHDLGIVFRTLGVVLRRSGH